DPACLNSELSRAFRFRVATPYLLFGALAAGAVSTRQPGGEGSLRAMRRPSPARPHAARRTTRQIAVRPVSLELLAAPTAGPRAALVAGTEPVGTSTGLADGELGNGTLRRLLTVLPGQRGPDERPVNGALFLF